MFRAQLMFAFLSLVISGFGQANADLIVNGSFESPAVPVGSYTNFAAGSAAITGWTVVGIDSAVMSGSFAQSGITFNAQDGDQWIDLAGFNSNSTLSGVSQDVATVAGQAYLLTFHVGSATDHVFFFPATIDLSIDGGARTSYTNPAAPTDHIDWLEFSVSFVASNAMTNIKFFNGGAPNNYNSALDGVSMTAVPEPGTATLLSCVFGTLGLICTRRRTMK